MKATQTIRPILRWPGRKTRMLKHLLPLIPPHVCYGEPFAGSLALLLAKDRSPVEIVNDVNGDLVALYRNLQFHLPELLREIDFAFAARRNIKDFMANPGLTEIQRAARFLVRNKTSFGGNMDSFGVAKTKGGGVGFSRETNTELLGEMHWRMDKVVVENLSCERFLKNYDSADSCGSSRSMRPSSTRNFSPTARCGLSSRATARPTTGRAHTRRCANSSSRPTK